MNEELMEISFGLIANAGEAKGLAYDALSKAKQGNFEEARELINKSREEMHKAHAFQTQLIYPKRSAGPPCRRGTPPRARKARDFWRSWE